MPYKDTSVDWLYFAKSDLTAAERLFEEAIYHLVCFHAHQAIEKVLKGALRNKEQNIPKTHDIVLLFQRVRQPTLASSDDIIFVNRFYIPTRYPDTFPGALPEGLPTREDAQKALTIAKSVLETGGSLMRRDLTKPERV